MQASLTVLGAGAKVITGGQRKSSLVINLSLPMESNGEGVCVFFSGQQYYETVGFAKV